MHQLLLAAALILAPVAAAAEDWQQVKGLEGIEANFWIDMDSVKVTDGLTSFRTKVAMPQFEGFAFVDSVADCKAQTAEMRHIEIVQDGKVMSAKDIAPGTESRSLKDAEGAVLMAMICK